MLEFAEFGGSKASAEVYRYRYNGKEQDNEICGEGDVIDFGSRIYDCRLGRWISTDRLSQFYSPYVNDADNPIRHYDLDGNWVPSVNKNGAIILTSEKGDNYNTLIKFFGSREIAEKYIPINTLNAMKKEFAPVPEGAQIYFNTQNMFSKVLKDAYLNRNDFAFGLNDQKGLQNQGIWGDSYNCYYLCLKLSKEGSIDGWRSQRTKDKNGDIMGPSITLEEFYRFLIDGCVDTKPGEEKFGKTIINFGDQHAAIFFGRDLKGNMYVFTKNGDKIAPIVKSVVHFENFANSDHNYAEPYGKVRPMSKEGKGKHSNGRKTPRFM